MNTIIAMAIATAAIVCTTIYCRSRSSDRGIGGRVIQFTSFPLLILGIVFLAHEGKLQIATTGNLMAAIAGYLAGIYARKDA